MSTKTKTYAPRMSDDAVKTKTGKDWKSWFALLDKSGAKNMSHSEIAQLLSTKHEVGPWWCQMVTVSYEHSRGLRDKHERPDGFQISVSRTISAPLSGVYKAFADPKWRQRWLPETELVVRKATANKSMRVTWKDGKTSLEINFYAKGVDKSQVVIQHSKLPDARSAARMKDYWSAAFDRLCQVLQG
jgi:uncharacterized protein DUF4287